MLELDDILLYRPAHLRQHHVVVALMPWEAHLAVEALIDLAAVLDLVVLVLLAEEPPWSVYKVLQLVHHILFALLFLRPRHEFLEGIHRVVMVVVEGHIGRIEPPSEHPALPLFVEGDLRRKRKSGI